MRLELVPDGLVYRTTDGSRFVDRRELDELLEAGATVTAISIKGYASGFTLELAFTGFRSRVGILPGERDLD